MLRGERLGLIMDKIKEKKFILVEELAQSLEVSPMTIRRDLNILDEGGQIERCYGGARIPQDTIAEIDYDIKKEQHRVEKKKIAENAMAYIEENDTIYLDSGTTTGEIAKLLCGFNKHVSVVTNELNIATILLESDVDLTIIGGIIQKKTKSAIGLESEQYLKQYRFSKVFIGTTSVDYDFDVFSPTYDKAHMKQMLIRQSSQIYLLADASKFYSQAMCYVASLNQFTGIITDKVFNETEKENIYKLNIKVIQV